MSRRPTASGSPFEGPWPPGEDVVAWGGSLDPDLVLDAYRHGVFPFHDARQPVLWWCPDPRAVVDPAALHVPRRLARTLRRSGLEVAFDTDFEAVVRGCAAGRAEGTWIHEGMVRCYVELHRRGHAHAVSVVRAGRLVGGIYGVAVGGLFAAESKFHRERDASKVALVRLASHLAARGFQLIDVQFPTPHLERFGVRTVPRDDFLASVRRLRDAPVRFADG